MTPTATYIARTHMILTSTSIARTRMIPTATSTVRTHITTITDIRMTCTTTTMTTMAIRTTRTIIMTTITITVMITVAITTAGIPITMTTPTPPTPTPRPLRRSTPMAGFAYLVIFDALGMLNIFISSVVTSNREFREANLKRPFGAQRSEIVFALATTLFLLFAAMYTTKESIEHMMLEEAGEKAGAKHEVSGRGCWEIAYMHGLFGVVCYRGFGVGSIVMMMIAVAVTLISSIGFSNHRNFAQILRTNTTTHGVTYSTIYPQRPSAVTVVFNNIFTVATLSCAATVILAALFDHAASAGSHDDHHAGYADKLASFAESFVMFYLGGPTAAAIAKILLQTSPDTVSGGLEMRLREDQHPRVSPSLQIQQDPSVLSIDRAHFWQNTYGQYVGTLEVRARPDASEQHVLQLVHQKLEGVLNVNGASAQGLGNGGAYGKPPVGAEAGAGELTVQICVAHLTSRIRTTPTVQRATTNVWV
ncbi:cation efflux family-domain-containing protein [Jimgerdemannia flammicorona]|uniref:Cation efflux family-domain-containing protein n=1 Tax=Jimgerdemannia flammicorona TaxID=994334 RepID=A0A433D2W3_9FUNG|nr:cation efflux family-domain-containing protein [Jimgerdemannia flammicorona]